MPNQSGKIVLVLILILLVAGAAVYFLLPAFKKQDYQEVALIPSVSNYQNQQEASTSSQAVKDYYSKYLKISIQIPNNARIQDDPTFVDIYIGDKRINISRIATNFSTAKEYVADFDSKREVSIETSKVLNVGNIKGIERIELFKEGPIREQKIIYLITKDGWVYSLSTSDESLYPVLDQIVQSFEYTP